MGRARGLADLSLAFTADQAVGIAGPQGSGKTTAVELLLGLLKPDAGRIMVDGRDVREDLGAWMDRLAYVPQHEAGSQLPVGRRAALARALARDRELLVMDEPTAGLEPEAERGIIDAVRGLRGKTLVIVSHSAPVLEVCDAIFALDGGRVREVTSHRELAVPPGVTGASLAMSHVRKVP